MLEAFAAYFLVKSFKWATQGVILLDVEFNNLVAMAVYNPGCAGIAFSKYLINKDNMKSFRVAPLTLSSANGVTTINLEVFNELKIKCKGKEVELPAVVLT